MIYRTYECLTFKDVQRTVQKEVGIFKKALEQAAKKENIANFNEGVANEIVNMAQANLLTLQFEWKGHLISDWYVHRNKDGSASIDHGYDANAFRALEFGYAPHWVMSDNPTEMGDTIGDWYVWFVTARGGGGNEEMQRKAERIQKGEVVPIHVMDPMHGLDPAGKFFHPAVREMEGKLEDKVNQYYDIHVHKYLESK